MSPEKPPPFRPKLSDASIRSLTTSGKYADGDVPGLYLQVRASLKPGKSPSRHWRLKYRLRGKENVFVIGRYPVSWCHLACTSGCDRNLKNFETALYYSVFLPLITHSDAPPMMVFCGAPCTSL